MSISTNLISDIIMRVSALLLFDTYMIKLQWKRFFYARIWHLFLHPVILIKLHQSLNVDCLDAFILDCRFYYTIIYMLYILPVIPQQGKITALGNCCSKKKKQKWRTSIVRYYILIYLHIIGWEAKWINYQSFAYTVRSFCLWADGLCWTLYYLYLPDLSL